MDKEQIGSTESEDENLEGCKIDANLALDTQPINESHSQLDDKFSQETYCSENSTEESCGNMEVEENVLNTSETTNASHGISGESTIDVAEMCELKKPRGTSLGEKSDDNIKDVSANDKSTDVSGISNTPDKTTIDDITDESVMVCNTPDVDNSHSGSVTKIKSLDTPQLECNATKRKFEDESKDDDTQSKKSRPSCMVIYEGTPKRKPLAMYDLTKASPVEEITILDETQSDFSLRLDSQTLSPNEEKDSGSGESVDTWKSHKNVSTENCNVSRRNSPWSSQVYKDNDLSWQSHNESKEDYIALKIKYDELLAKLDKLTGGDSPTLQFQKNSPDTNSSSTDGLHSYTENCFLGGVVKFTINETTNQIVMAEVKQLSILSKAKKQRSSLSSGVMADKSFSSGTSGDSKVSMPGPFNPPVARCSILSTTSSSSSATSVLSSASAYPRGLGIRNFDGPFLVPSLPLKNSKDLTSQPLTGFGQSFPPVENLEDFSHCYNLPNGSPEFHSGSVEEKIAKFESLVPCKNDAVNIKENPSQEILHEEKEEKATEEEEKVDARNAVTPQRKGRGRPKKSVTPAKSKAVVPENTLKPSMQPVEEEKMLVKPEGKAVFAKWSDCQYYPGWVTGDMNTSRVTVNFCDGNVTVLSSVKVIPADWIKSGTIALAQHRDKNEYSPCLVMNVELGDKNGPVFIVDGNSSSSTLDFSQIALTESQVAEIKGEAIATGRMPSHHLVSLDNVLSHPRTRISRTPSQTTPVKTPRRGTPSRKRNDPSTSKGLPSSDISVPEISGDNDSTVSSIATESIRGNEGFSLDPEFSPEEFPSNSKRKTSQQNLIKSTIKKSKKALEEDFALEKNYGPLPEEGSEIFVGCNFLITYSDQKKKYNVKRNFSSSSGCDLSCTNESTGDEEFELKSFNKQRLRAQIKKGGGKLYQTFQHVPPSEYKHTYLITDGPSCTPLYLQCLVHGISIYNHKLIIDCCTKNHPFNEMVKASYLLPAGWSLERTVYKNQQKNIQPFKKLKEEILLALNQNKANIRFWRKLLQAAGAKVNVYTDKVASLDRISVIVAEGDCSSELIDEANKYNVPVVSLVWVEQCIIDGILRPFQGHPEYKYIHFSKSQSPEY